MAAAGALGELEWAAELECTPAAQLARCLQDDDERVRPGPAQHVGKGGLHVGERGGVAGAEHGPLGVEIERHRSEPTEARAGAGGPHHLGGAELRPAEADHRQCERGAVGSRSGTVHGERQGYSQLAALRRPGEGKRAPIESDSTSGSASQ